MNSHKSAMETNETPRTSEFPVFFGFSQSPRNPPFQDRKISHLANWGVIVHSDARLILLSRIDGDAPRA